MPYAFMANISKLCTFLNFPNWYLLEFPKLRIVENDLVGWKDVVIAFFPSHKPMKISINHRSLADCTNLIWEVNLRPIFASQTINPNEFTIVYQCLMRKRHNDLVLISFRVIANS